MGLKLHNALYPSMEALLAEAVGMSTAIDSEKWMMVKIRWVGDFLVFMFFPFGYTLCFLFHYKPSDVIAKNFVRINKTHLFLQLNMFYRY